MIGMAYQNMHCVWLFLMSLENEVQKFSDQSVPSMLTLGVVLVKIRGDGVLSKTWESHAERRDVVLIDGITTRGRTTRREVGAGARDPGARLENTSSLLPHYLGYFLDNINSQYIATSIWPCSGSIAQIHAHPFKCFRL